MSFKDDKSEHPAYRDLDSIADFVSKCWHAGRISREDKELVFEEFVRITNEAGFTANSPGDRGARLGLDEASIAVVRHAAHVMRRKLLELHPELTEEVRGLGGGQER